MESTTRNTQDVVMSMALDEVFMEKLSSLIDVVLDQLEESERGRADELGDKIISLGNEIYSFGVRVGAGLAQAAAEI